MSAIIVRPLPFSAASTSPAPLAGSVANLNVDHPAFVWRFGLTAPYLIVDLGAGALAYDWVALAGCNLRAGDAVQIRTGTTDIGTGGYTGSLRSAYAGAKGDLSTTDAIFKLGSTRTERYIRLDIVANGHPDGFVQVQRLIVGAGIVASGVSYDAEMSFVDQSIITAGSGYTAIDEFDVLTAWKLRVPFIGEASWRSEWYPLLQYAGNKRCVLFIPDDSTPENWQTDAIFGRFNTSATGKAEGFNAWAWEGSIIELAP